ncbi:N-acetylglucosamine kinase [Ktedonospora formicarum]|uniref:N-acetylglucosamine kinase n=1 Tax=Ktedonospora formicarum TaxID=2778364 RepID=A0A8J3I9A4_9CHLR|nr:BadF/BadG/BcrA/BcrD ATPase family protein [Ktedonospora formicarum]GHO51006.1 N-acetylglucosamine kinase [Ktedonospora formicarum]
MHRKQGCYLGVDCGGSKTQAVIVDDEGRELGRGLAGSANYTQVGLEQAIQNIQQAVEETARMADCSLPVRKAWFGIAGIARQADIDMFLTPLRGIAEIIHITNDAELGLCALPERVGVAIIAGTGAITLGRNSLGYKARADGWGYLLGNEGSGYYIGQKALTAALQYADGRGQSTMLLDLILQQWGLTRPEEVIAKVYAPAGRATVARLSTCVFQAARQGDEIAGAIVEQGAYELARTCKAVSRRLSFPRESLFLALVGGLFVHEADYRERVLTHIRDTYTLGRVEIVTTSALSAALAASQLPLDERLPSAQS